MKAVLVILDIIVVIASVLLTLLILMHKGKGGGISDMFGGGIGSNAGTSGVAEKNLNRITVIVALIWLAVIIALGLLARFGYTL
ncbi:MAG: preprotein translocase subunit SecG [Aeriscardovia sp.]|nr:preprotein translocase subunit SecG [Aeriscardovia sp.]MBO5633462.1 preprotein translocase subunit SecG [Aeriscardovia sp.]MBR4414187.1 preprotein translocase subunit SecG [Aeriscardovia sp.]